MKEKRKNAIKKIKKWRKYPIDFVKDNFDVKPVEWQQTALIEIADGQNVAVKAGRGVGKTATLAWICLWYLTTHQEPRVPCTAPVRDHLRHVLWPEINKWLQKSDFLSQILETTGEKVQLKESPNTHFAVARTARKKENLQGFNANNIIFLVDEGSAIDPKIIDAVRGSLLSGQGQWVMAGNPTRVSGRFHDIWDKDYGDFIKLTVNSKKCELTNRDQVKALEKDYPPGTAQHKMYIEGKFPPSDSEAFIPRKIVELGLDRSDEEWEKDEENIYIGVDVARSGDNKTVVAVRNGNKIVSLDSTPTTDVTEVPPFVNKRTHHWWDQLANQLNVPKDRFSVYIRVDDVGIGGSVTDRLTKEYKNHPNIFIRGVHAQEKPNDKRLKELYKNAITAGWALIREKLQERTLILPDDPNLIEQLCSRKGQMLESGRTKLEPKKKMSGPSPDEADAVAYAMMNWFGGKEYKEVSPVTITGQNKARIA